MGLMIHSLGILPDTVEKNYYIYLLDYGWHESLGEALNRNFNRMADLASKHNAVVMKGTVGSHFVDDVLSFHHINGEKSDDLLPAILITTRHPQSFLLHEKKENYKDKLVLIPLKSACKTTSEVASLIDKIFQDIKNKKQLSEFKISRQMKSGSDGAITDALILEPNFAGIGIDIKKIISFFKK